MRDAGAVEHRPLRFGNRALIADRQCHDHTRVRRGGKCRDDSGANALPGTLHVIAGASGKEVASRIEAFGMHVSGRAQSLLQQPRLEIESTRGFPAVPCGRFSRTVRYQRSPAWTTGASCVGSAGPYRREPRQRKPRRDNGAWRAHALDAEREACALRRVGGQVVDNTDDLDVLAFPRARQFFGEPALRTPGRVAETGQQRRRHQPAAAAALWAAAWHRRWPRRPARRRPRNRSMRDAPAIPRTSAAMRRRRRTPREQDRRWSASRRPRAKDASGSADSSANRGRDQPFG